MEAVYEAPYVAHALMEPLACVADVRADSCEVWASTQAQTFSRATAAQAAGCRPMREGEFAVHRSGLGAGLALSMLLKLWKPPGRRRAGKDHVRRAKTTCITTLIVRRLT
jgi:CO/xanthine dehydrogenase Mo-binding subunit